MTAEDGRIQLSIEDLLQKILPQGTVSIQALRAIYHELTPEIQSAELIPLAQTILYNGDELQTVVDGLLAASKSSGVLGSIFRDPTKRHYENAAKALADGDFSRADEQLAAVEAHHLASPTSEACQAATKARVERAKVSLLRTNPAAYRIAAEHYMAAAHIIQKSTPDTAWDLRIEEGLTLIKLFEKFEDPNGLIEAVGLFHTILEGPVPNSHERATTWSHIGDAMSLLGNYANDPQILKQAADAFREAVNTYSRQQVAMVWATAQAQLGDTLSSLAQYEDGTSLLEEAAAAYRAALEEYNSAFAGFVRTSILIKLADALKMLVMRGSPNVNIKDAIATYRQAMSEIAHGEAPEQWAALQAGLNGALAMDS